MANKLFSDLVTFSRGTGATRVNSAGMIVGVDFSATSNTIATGSNTFTLTADANVDRDWAVNSNVIAVSQAGATGSMTGTVTSYTPSTQTLVINVTSVTGSGTSTNWRIGSLEMREDHDPVTLVRKGVLSESASTNYAVNSQNITWTASGASAATLIVDSSASILGEACTRVDMDQNTVFPGITTAFALRNSAWFVTAGEVRNFSVFVYLSRALVGAEEIVFLETGMSGTTPVRLTSTINADASNRFIRIFNSGGAIVVTGQNQIRVYAQTQISSPISIYICKVQSELGYFPTSYIPTTTVQVTRNADNFQLTAAAVASIRQGEGTLYAEIDCPDTGLAQKRALRLSGADADIRIGKQGVGTLANFTKMVEGHGLILMANTGASLTSNNGLEYNLISPIRVRTGVASQVTINGAISFSGTSFMGAQNSADIGFPSDLSTATVVSIGPTGINGAHWTGTSFIAATTTSGIIVKSTDGISYRVINTPVITQSCFEVTSGLVGGTNRVVIVGDIGFIATSDDDGETWVSRTSGSTAPFRAIHYFNNRYVAVTSANSSKYSNDGVTWTTVTGLASTGLDIYHNGTNLWVTVGSGGVIYSSPDGITWTQRTSPVTQSLNGVHFADGLWVAGGDLGTIVTSPDGITWTNRTVTSGTTQSIQEINFFNGRFCYVNSAGGFADNTASSIVAGTSWTSRSTTVTSTLAGIAASPTTLLITGSAGAIVSSTNGTTFTSRTNNGATLNGIAFGNNTFVSVGNAANGSGYIATTGADNTVTRRVSGTTSNLVQIRFLNGQFLVCSSSTTPGILTSADGITFNSRNTNLPLGVTPFDVSFGNSIYIAVGATGRAATSSDSVSWSGAATGVTTQQLNGIDFSNGMFVAVGNAGTIITTTNGTTWTLRTSGTTANLNSVMFSTRDNLWYAAGSTSTLLHSPDAITWTAVQNGGTASILSTTLQVNQPLSQFKSGVNKIGISYKSNQVVSALNGITSSTDIAANIPSITAGNIGENLNGYIRKIDIYRTALTATEISAKTM